MVKSNINFSLFFFFFFFLFYQCNAQTISLSEELNWKFASKDLISDLDFILEKISQKEFNRDPYNFISESDFKQQVKNVKEYILKNDSLGRIDFFKKVGSLLTLLKDDHTLLKLGYKELYAKLKDNLSKEHFVFLLSTIVYNGFCYVAASDTIPIKSRIVSINDIPILDIIQQTLMHTTFSEYFATTKNIITSFDFPKYAVEVWSLYNFENQSKIKYIPYGQENEEEIIVTLHPYFDKALMRTLKIMPVKMDKNPSLEFKDSLAVLRLPSFFPGKNINEGLKKWFAYGPSLRARPDSSLLDHERVVARRLEGLGEPREHARPSCSMATSCRASACARARSGHRTPRRWPGARGTRPAAGHRARAHASTADTETPASPGSPGPGEITRPSGRRASSSSTGSTSLRTTSTPRAELAEVLHEVVRERIVVVDHRGSSRRRPLSPPFAREIDGLDQRAGLVHGTPGTRARDPSPRRRPPRPAGKISPSFTQERPDRDGRVHVARVVDVADAAAVGAAPHGLELVDDLHRAHLGRPRERARRERRAQQVEPVEARTQPSPSRSTRCASRGSSARSLAYSLTFTEPISATRPTSLRAEVHEHQVLRALLRVGEQLGLEGDGPPPACARGARARDRARTSIWPSRDAPGSPARAADQDRPFAAQEEEVRARVDRAQVPVDRERVDLQRHAEALREHHLEDVARLDVLLRALHHLVELLAGHARAARPSAPAPAPTRLRLGGERHAEPRASRRRRSRLAPVARAGRLRARHLDRGARSAPSAARCRRRRRSPAARTRGPAGRGSSGFVVGNPLDEAHPVVADHPDRSAQEARQLEALGRHRRAAREPLAQHLERIARAPRSARVCAAFAPLDLAAARAEDRARAAADEAVARPLLAALDRLEAGRSCARRRAGGTARAACRGRRGSRARRGSGFRGSRVSRTLPGRGGARLPRTRALARAATNGEPRGYQSPRRESSDAGPLEDASGPDPVFPDPGSSPPL